ncbi:von Willebrand factor A [Geoanaerobacter pelophilus]|uniref:von Willebrand factor A n=1 Tax=Geoanaerobacter pelophilus TaxID=60036 RepID=A0ABQ0MDS7_9BACT|nr:Tad domain-containing protein [Geoanaerobacter pelophilus]GAW65270.1 von Willebrand factor A [Geoanaerobacter pelophilus]
MKILQGQPRGQILLVAAAIMFFGIFLAALAVDAGRAYGVKAKMHAAVDAASFEAAKALAQGEDEDDMEEKASRAARDYFWANFPAAYFGAECSGPELELSERKSEMKLRALTVSATAKLPNVFAGILGWESIDLPARSRAVRTDADVVLVLDSSDALRESFPQVKQRVGSFSDRFSQRDDRLSLVTFATGADPVISICGVYRPGKDHPPKESYSCGSGYLKSNFARAVLETSAETTNAAAAPEEAMHQAKAQLDALRSELRAQKRVIVLLASDAAAGNIKEETAAALRKDKVFIHAVEITGSLKASTPAAGGNGRTGSENLKRFANTKDSGTHEKGEPTGSYCQAADLQQLELCLEKIANGMNVSLAQ